MQTYKELKNIIVTKPGKQLIAMSFIATWT